MPVAFWTDHFKTGIDSIDAQHEALLESLHGLSCAFEKGQPDPTLNEMLASIVRRIIKHFQTEETLMKEVGYPTRCEHLNQHCELILQIRTIQYKQSNGHPMNTDIATFLASWFEHHIREVDMDYVNFMRGMKA
jgi:hemerythrin-like metal-binding protein